MAKAEAKSKESEAPEASDLFEEQPAAKAAEAPAAVQVAEPPAAPALKQFDVTFGEKKERVSAASAAEAWSAFCDSHKHWPSPDHGKVVEVTG